MSESTDLLRSAATVGGPPKKRPAHPITLESKWLTSSEQALPLRVIHGRDRVAGIHMFPVFSAGAEEVTTEVGK